MISSRTDPPMSLKDRMKFFEAAAEAERNKTSAPPPRRHISSSGSSSAFSSTPGAPRPSHPTSPGAPNPTTPNSTTPKPTTPNPRATRLSTPGGRCARVSLSRTISGESVVQEVLSPISLPTRTRVEEEDVFSPLTLQDITRCKFGEVRRNSVEVVEHSNTHYLATRVEPVENRVVEEDEVKSLGGGRVDLDRDSGVSCSSDEQDQLLSDTEAGSMEEMKSVDSGVYAGKLNRATRVIIRQEIVSKPELRDSLKPEQKVILTTEQSDPIKSPVDLVPNGNEKNCSPSADKTNGAVKSPTIHRQVSSVWSTLLEEDYSDSDEENKTHTTDEQSAGNHGNTRAESEDALVESEDARGDALAESEEARAESEDACAESEDAQAESEGTKADSEEDALTIVDTSVTDEDKAPFHSPFEGTINLAMSAKEAITSQPPSHKGFLTIFQEESGLGAWNRRWCSVQDNKIYYWLYPEDEVNQNKEPHGEIDLRKCKNEQVSIASRLDCARPNTFVLILLTAAQPGDRTSIITESNGKTTQTKYMLAADSKEERKQWMEVLNKCLQSIHSWNH